MVFDHLFVFFDSLVNVWPTYFFHSIWKHVTRPFHLIFLLLFVSIFKVNFQYKCHAIKQSCNNGRKKVFRWFFGNHTHSIAHFYNNKGYFFSQFTAKKNQWRNKRVRINALQMHLYYRITYNAHHTHTYKYQIFNKYNNKCL